MRKPKTETPDWGNVAGIEDVELPGAAPVPERGPAVVPAQDDRRYFEAPWPEIPTTLGECLALCRRIDNSSPPRDRGQRLAFFRWVKEVKAKTFAIQQGLPVVTMGANAHAQAAAAIRVAGSLEAADAQAAKIRARIKSRSSK